MRALDPHGAKTIFTRRSRGLFAVGAATLALASQFAVPTTRASVVVDVPESAVVATCDPGAKVDQTPALLAFVQAHSTPGTTLRFKRGGCYWINNVIDIENKHDLTFDGNGATFKTIDAGFTTRPSDSRLDRVWPRIRSMWRFEGGYHLTLKNLSIIGSNGGPNAAIDPRSGRPFRWDFHCPEVEPPHPFCLEGQAGVTLFGVNSENKDWGAKIDGVNVKYTFGYGIELHGWGAHLLNHGIEVRNSKIERVGSMALVAQNVDGAVFENNVLITPRRSMFNIEPPTPGMPSSNVLVNRNLMIDEDDPTDTKTGHFYMFANGGNTDALVENIWITNNQLVNQPVNAFINLGNEMGDQRHTSRKNIHIINNVSNIPHGAPFPDQAPIRAIGVDGLEVRGNTQAIQPNQRNYGVSVYGINGALSSNITVRDNHFANALGALYTDPSIPGTLVCNNRVGLNDQVDEPCTTLAGQGLRGPKIVVPGDGKVISGGQFLSAAAPSSTTRVEYLISGNGFFYRTHLGDATKTGYGWVYSWNTLGSRSFPNGKYWLMVRAFDAHGTSLDSPQVQVTVRNL